MLRFCVETTTDEMVNALSEVEFIKRIIITDFYLGLGTAIVDKCFIEYKINSFIVENLVSSM